MPFTTYAENKMIDHANGKTAWTLPAAPSIGLFTVIPTKAYTSGSPTGTELTGSGYVREAASYAAASGGSGVTNADILFPNATSDYSADVVAWGLFDAATNGNLIYFHELQTVVTAEAITLATTGAATGSANLANSDVSNVVVKDSTNTTTYTEGTDYYVQYPAGVITRISSGSILAGATIHVTYQDNTTRTVKSNDQMKFASGSLGVSLKGFD